LLKGNPISSAGIQSDLSLPVTIFDAGNIELSSAADHAQPPTFFQNKAAVLTGL
jgi:hypothetical protein